MKVSKRFPGEEKYSLTDNIKRSARSVTNNIAEGYGRFHYQENMQFCRVSRGSLHETLDHLMIALEEEYIDQEKYEEGKKLILDAIAILNGYINYLERAKGRKYVP
jgi:four helix bundle protein